MIFKDYKLKFPSGTNKNNKPEYIIVHHDVWPGATMEDIHRDHINNRKFNGTGYHFRIRTDGTVEIGRPVEMSGAHCKESGMNFKSIGVVFEGNFTDHTKIPTTRKMPEIQFIRGIELIQTLMKDFNIPLNKVMPHNYYAKKDCPGKYFPLSELLKELGKTKEHWGVPGIKWMKEVGLITSDHNPEDTVTWAEFAVVIRNLYLRRNE